ncbi:MAG: PilN domain-containing protein [Phycisphaerales bacterium]|nr:PilN domain-containing protein [Phycisphaerales bacterium]
MSGPMIDLMPASIRQRTQAGARTRRCITTCAAITLLAGGAATWASLRLDGIESDLVQAEALASRALELEQQAIRCNATASAVEAAIDEYHQVSYPVSVSSLVAALAQTLPQGATLERITLSLDDSPARASTESAQRRLQGTVSGFAASDEDVALLARRLDGREPFGDVRLEYSRSRTVHQHAARGFAVSFDVDMNQTYVVVGPTEQPEGAVVNADTQSTEVQP